MADGRTAMWLTHQADRSMWLTQATRRTMWLRQRRTAKWVGRATADENFNNGIAKAHLLLICWNAVGKLATDICPSEIPSLKVQFLVVRDTTAIASHEAAKLYSLNVVVDNIQDDMNDLTRFVMLAREPIIPRIGRPFRTSIVFSHDNRTSVLFKVLSVFAFRNINFTKIESRPHRVRPLTIVDDANIGMAKHFELMFYVDFDASIADVRAQNALADVQEFTSFLCVLGSYPIDMAPCGRCHIGDDGIETKEHILVWLPSCNNATDICMVSYR
ncbi:arogenate dehydratase/prephenate dehydratase 6, chloroplastic-like protein [Tanacetum coccineum]